MAVVIASASFALVASAQGPDTSSKSGGARSQENVAEIGAKPSNPVSDVWALFTQFGLTLSDGDLNTGDPEVGGNISFQPILPIPLHGSGEDAWRLIVRPTIPLLVNPVPQGFDRFDMDVGLDDRLLPFPIAAPAGNSILALGPTSTKDAFGRQQWAVGPAGIPS